MRRTLQTLVCAFICINSIWAQLDWTLNPKVLNDTIEAHVYPNSDIFITHVYDNIIDDNGTFWISSIRHGLFELNPNHHLTYVRGKSEWSGYNNTEAHKMYNFNNELYITTEKGFNTFNPTNGLFKTFGQNDIKNLEAYKADIHSMTMIGQDSFLLGSKWGLVLFDKAKNKIINELWEEDIKVDGASSYDYVRQLIVDPKDPNTIWGVGRKGLFFLKKGIWEIEYIRYLDNVEWGSYMDYMNDLVKIGDAIYILYCGDQRTWDKNGNQILKYDLKTKAWTKVLRHTFTNKYGQNFIPVINTFKAYGQYILVCDRPFGPQIIDTETDQVLQVYMNHDRFKENHAFKNPDRPLDNYLINIYAGGIDKNGYFWGVQARENLIRSKEPLLIKSIPPDFGEITMNEIIINGEKKAKSNYMDSLDQFSYRLNPLERNFGCSFSLTNAAVDSLIYEYQITNCHWRPAIDNKMLQINELNPGTNKINLRVRSKDQILDQKQLLVHTEALLQESFWFKLIGIGALGLFLFLIFKWRTDKIRVEERLKANFKKQIAEVEMQALRAQMNPHFLFNCLNSIKHYAINKSKDDTAEYITTFSRLIRQILQNSNEKVISLEQEIRAVELYIAVEQKRFDQQFEYSINIEKEINEDITYIPPMIIQPYIENAIWHGLMHKKEGGMLSIDISQDQSTIICTIEDNGIGRSASAKMSKKKSPYKKKSLGTKITADRIKLTEDIYNIKTNITTIDLYDENDMAVGTRVNISIPKIQGSTLKSLRTTNP